MGFWCDFWVVGFFFLQYFGPPLTGHRCRNLTGCLVKAEFLEGVGFFFFCLCWLKIKGSCVISAGCVDLVMFKCLLYLTLYKLYLYNLCCLMCCWCIELRSSNHTRRYNTSSRYTLASGGQWRSLDLRCNFKDIYFIFWSVKYLIWVMRYLEG